MRSEERVHSMNDVITGIARRSIYKFRDKTVEELSQELWIKVLEKERAIGYDLDLDLIARVCYDYVVDLQRYGARRNHLSLDELIENSGDEDSGLNGFFSHFDDPDNIDRILINDLINIFPEGSQERIFLIYHCTSSGYKDFGVEGNGKRCDGYTESDLAHKLGYTGTGNRGFKNFKKKMRELVKEYLNDNIKED